MKIDPICNMEVNEKKAIMYDDDGIILYFCSEGCKAKYISLKNSREKHNTYDLIIIGGGPAGLTAGVYAALLRLNVCLISKDLGGQAIDSTKIKNYMGYDFVTGPELIEKFKDQFLHSNYIDHIMGEVKQITVIGKQTILTTENGKTHTSKSLILATGMRRRRLGIPGEEKYQRKGIFFGNIQDMSFLQNKSALVIGGGNSAMQIVENLHTVAQDIYLVSDIPITADANNIEKIRKMKNVKVFEGSTITEFGGEDNLQFAELEQISNQEKTKLEIRGAFIAIGLQPNSAIAADIVDLNKKGEVLIENNCATSVPMIFAAGDVTNAFGKRIVIASGEGAKATMAVRQYLLDLKKTEEL
ncbi:MAG: FAD-dependent oxidoreductase [Candidatus Cloacimonetes bacterium]|jgi:alkyl hydroperoxide reductase subunit F|nr:FAD-dependent oxidoreductase [Candidatus Cloacimonadota bacterium]